MQTPSSPAHSVQEALSLQHVKNCVSTTHSKQRDEPIKKVLVPLKLFRDSYSLQGPPPEAEFQRSADSGPLEAKKSAEDCTLPPLTEQSQ